MTSLTESIVLSRTRADDLNAVRKLNCWGSELGDVSLLRNMKNVEVLSLSVNKIQTLADFAYCLNLQELYIRKNEISDLGDVCYLKELKKLRNLWLADNPCSEAENYRLSVIKTLPNLQKLDNIIVKPEEVQDAMLYGDSLSLEAKLNKEEQSSSPIQTIIAKPKERPTQHIEVESEPIRDENKNISEDAYRKISQSESMNSIDASSIGQRGLPTSYPTSISAQELSSPIQVNSERQLESQPNTTQPPPAFQAKVQTLVEHSRVPGHQQAHVEQNLGNPFPYDASHNASQQQNFDTIVHTCFDHNSITTENGHRHSVSLPASHGISQVGMHRSHSAVDRSSPTRSFTGRGKNRNSNILSAILCLIKELDYANLEVVETAVQCRMLELEDYVSP